MFPSVNDLLPTVLVAEDELLLLKSLDIKLRKEGFQVILCHDGPSALQALQVHRPAVVITDLNLPGLSGCELVRAAKTLAEPAYVIATSGTDDHLERKNMLDCGADQFLCKPFNLSKLAEHLKQQVGMMAA